MSLPATLPPPDALRDLSRTLAAFWSLLERGIGVWSQREPAAPLPALTLGRVGRIVARLQAILALLAAGKLPRHHPPRSNRAETTRAETTRAAPAGPPPLRPPARWGWLAGKSVDTVNAVYELIPWLADPAVRAVLEQVPQARRPLAGLCRMLGIAAWPLQPTTRRPPRKPGPPRPRRPRPPPEPEEVFTHHNTETELGLADPNRPWWLISKRQRRRYGYD